jgi:anaerobic selenocysteine-containing dehydrogenase
MPELQKRSALGREARIVNMSLLGKALTELDGPPVKAMVVYNSNPAAIAPDQNVVLGGLRREDLFTVVLEQLQTDTADYADILLPATTFLEHTDIYFAYGHYHMPLARPAVAAPGEARSNVDIFRGLALRMGFDDPCHPRMSHFYRSHRADSERRRASANLERRTWSTNRPWNRAWATRR